LPKYLHFYSVQRIPFLVKFTPTSLHEKKTGWRRWTLILILCVDVHMGLDPSPPSTCVQSSTWAWPLSPLRVDVIKGWPLNVTVCQCYTYTVLFQLITSLIVLVSSKLWFNLINDMHHFHTKSLLCEIKKNNDLNLVPASCDIVSPSDFRGMNIAASIWFEIWGVVDPGQKNLIF